MNKNTQQNPEEEPNRNEQIQRVERDGSRPSFTEVRDAYIRRFGPRAWRLYGSSGYQG